MGIGGDELGSLAGGNELPFIRSRIRVVLARLCELLRWARGELADEVADEAEILQARAGDDVEVVRSQGGEEVAEATVLERFVLKVANGPKRRCSSSSTTRLSRCGTDIGGAPTSACP